MVNIEIPFFLHKAAVPLAAVESEILFPLERMLSRVMCRNIWQKMSESNSDASAVYQLLFDFFTSNFLTF